MLTYAVLASKGSGPVPDAVLTRIRSTPLPEVPLVADEVMSWSNRNGSVVFMGWEATSPIEGVGSHRYEDPGGITAFSGHVWPRAGLWGPSEGWAAQLSAMLRRGGFTGAPDKLFGVYTAAHLSTDDEGFVFSDPFGSGLLYCGEQEDLFVVSNRAALAARVLEKGGSEPSRDPLGVGWTCFFGYIIGEDTTFSGVKALPPAGHVRLDGRGTASIRTTPRAWEKDGGAPGLEATLNDLRATVISTASIPAARRTLGLSGGKDSRLLLALLLSARLADRFQFVTDGLPRSPDVVVARELAERFGLDHRVQPPSYAELSPDEYFERLRVHTYHHSGMLNAWNLRGFTASLTDQVHVGGMFGELMRSHYARGGGIENPEQARAYFGSEMPFDAAGLLRPDAKRYYLDTVDSWMTEQLDRGAAPQDLPDLFYLQHRVRRWVGTLQEMNAAMLVHPLQSPAAVAWALAGGHQARRTDNLHFRLMREACEPLAKMRFAGDGWDEENFAGLPDADDYRNLIPAMPDPDSPHPRGQWAMYPVVRSCFEDYLLETRRHPIYEIVDRRRLEQAVRTAGRLNASGKVALYAVLSSAIWLARDEKPTPFNQEGAAPPSPPLLVVARKRARARRLRRERRKRFKKAAIGVLRRTPLRAVVRRARRSR